MKDYFTVTELADHFRVNPKTIKNWVKQGRIPFETMNGELRFLKDEIKKSMICNMDMDNDSGIEKMRRLSLRNSFHSKVILSLKKNKEGCAWESVVDYDLKTLREKLKSTIPKGYTWQDFVEGRLHLDHIIPGCAFNIDSIDSLEFKRCWALKNLQLLPAKEHREKGRKVLQPFQMGFNLKGVTSNERNYGTIS